MQRLLTVIILAILVYSVVIYREGDDEIKGQDIVTNLRNIGSDIKSLGEDILMPNKNMEEFEQAFEGNIIERSLSKVAVNVLKTEDGQRFFSKMITPEMQRLQGQNDYRIDIRDTKLIENMLSLRTLRQGKGSSVTCGHMVEVYYVLSRNGEEILETKEMRALGSKSEIPILDSVVVGMKVGEVREAIIPKEFTLTMAEKHPRESYTVRIALESVSSNNLIKPESIRIFDDTVSYNIPYLCGDTAEFDAKITSISDGKVIFDTILNKQKVRMSVGDTLHPLIFSYALFNKPPIGMRTLIVQGKYFDNFMGKSQNAILPDPLNRQEFYLLELNNFTRTGSQAILLPGSKE